MKKLLTLFLMTIVIVLPFTSRAQLSMTYLNHWQITPNTDDTSGVFCRTFYHQGRDKYYVVYAGRPSSTTGMQYYTWREYDAGMNYTGSRGTLSGLTGAGDFAMIMEGNYYYHLADVPPWNFKLSKYDDNFNLVASTLITLDSSDSQADMMMNYTNGRLVIGAYHVANTYHPSMPNQQPSWNPNMHKWEYDLNLNQLTTPVYLNETFTPWGASCIYNNNQYNIITMRKWPQYRMRVYQYDNNWNFVDSVLINNDGQWSQGLFWDGSRYFVTYHSGNEHRSGNITAAIFDINWNLLYDTVITNNPDFVFNVSPPLFTTEHNANRPFLVVKGDTLIVSYDVDDYQLQSYTSHSYVEGNRWMANVTWLRVNLPTGINGSTTEHFFTLYPDPADEKIFLCTQEEGEYLVMDMSGREISGGKVMRGMETIDISFIDHGMYIMQFTTSKGVSTQKFVVR